MLLAGASALLLSAARLPQQSLQQAGMASTDNRFYECSNALSTPPPPAPCDARLSPAEKNEPLHGEPGGA